jgi:hypothetical protein
VQEVYERALRMKKAREGGRIAQGDNSGCNSLDKVLGQLHKVAVKLAWLFLVVTS